MSKTIDVFVVDEHKGGLTLICSTKEDGSDTFLLAKKAIIEPRSYRKGKMNTFDIQDYAWEMHRQLCGDEIFEKAKKKRAEWKKGR